MKCAFIVAMTAGLLGLAMTVSTMAQVGAASGISRGGATAAARSTLPLGTDGPQLDAAAAYRAHGDVPKVIPGAVPSRHEISSVPVRSFSAPIVIPARIELSEAAISALRSMGTTPTRNPACTGTAADADVCAGWE